jgi:hypothetical protein
MTVGKVRMVIWVSSLVQGFLFTVPPRAERPEIPAEAGVFLLFLSGLVGGGGAGFMYTVLPVIFFSYSQQRIAWDVGERQQNFSSLSAIPSSRHGKMPFSAGFEASFLPQTLK